MKILAIQFKYLGDAVFITPALKALHQQYPEAEIHVLAAEEVLPVFRHIPFIKKAWGLPRTRGKAKLMQTLPLLGQLIKEKFDISIDFAGNDRGAILSLLIRAPKRIAAVGNKHNLIHKLAYNSTVQSESMPKVWVQRHLKMLSLLLNTIEPKNTALEIHSNPSLQNTAKKILNNHEIICHIGTSQQKKEWPTSHWLKLYSLVKNAGYKIAFTSGINDREQALMRELKKEAPDLFELPTCESLELFIAVLDQAKVVVSGDTGPLHFAAGLGKKVIGLFAVHDGVEHYAPIYKKNEVIIGKPCTCTGDLVNFSTCQKSSSCMSSISAEQVFKRLKERFPLGAL
jgi:ADP-heptose:LPS heptosyltransferase